jgi:hypothetical protein
MTPLVRNVGVVILENGVKMNGFSDLALLGQIILEIKV